MKRANSIIYVSCLLILFSLGFSFLSGTFGLMVSVTLALLIIAMYNVPNEILGSKKQLIIFSLILLIAWHSRESNLFGWFSVILRLVAIYSLVRLDNRLIYETKNMFLLVFAIVSAVSLFFWCLYLIGFDFFPSIPITMEGVYKLDNHIAFITDDNSFDPRKRFQCLFIEPGFYGILCVCCLMLNHYSKDWKSFVYLLSACFTLSLATYILLSVILFYRMYIGGKKLNMFKIIFPICVVFGVFYGATNYKDGDNIINESIVWRLKLNDERKLEYYNRRTDIFDYYYDKHLNGMNFLFGIGPDEYTRRGFENCVDLKGYIALDGILGVALFLFYYISVLKYCKVNKESIASLFIFSIIFYRGYVMSLSLGGLILYYVTVVSSSVTGQLKRSSNENFIRTPQ